MSIILIHSIILTLTVSVAFLASKMIPPHYNIYVTAITFVIYFSIKRLIPQPDKHRLFDSIIFTFIMMVIVYSTGGLASPLFFLTYFLLFALALILEPVISMTTAFAIIAIFIITLSPSNRQSIQDLIPLFSLPFLVPFALFLGNEYRKIVQQRKTIQFLQRKEHFLKESYSEDKEDHLLFLSIIMKGHLKMIRQLSENFTGDQDLERIKKVVRRMDKLIEKYEKTA